MLMSDSLGGSAKTLMFVNVSPSDSNIDESSNSLAYATRVRTIKNDVSKNEANKDVLKWKKTVRPVLSVVCRGLHICISVFCYVWAALKDTHAALNQALLCRRNTGRNKQVYLQRSEHWLSCLK